MAQIIRITSEALQATIRRLLPSQVGFGEDLQASNVIQPIIDLTPTAEGSSLPDYLQTALSYTDVTHYIATTSTTIVSNTGFFRLVGNAVLQGATSASNANAQIQLTGSGSNKILAEFGQRLAASQAEFFVVPFDLYVFVKQGESVTAAGVNGGSISVAVRQVADINGNLIDPTGFTPQ